MSRSPENRILCSEMLILSFLEETAPLTEERIFVGEDGEDDAGLETITEYFLGVGEEVGCTGVCKE